VTDEPGAGEWVPAGAGIDELASAAGDCRGCELWQEATQVVFSTGSAGARMVLVGEQPGDREDREGEPFVGPAGGVLDDALEAAGIARRDVYLTNAVKHFRHEHRGKRRLHQKPDLRHLVACHPWLEAELSVVAPDVVVALGATAGRAVLGRPVRVGAERGRPLEGPDAQDDAGRGADTTSSVTSSVTSSITTVLTTHPSAVLRLRGKEGYDAAFGELVDDLAVAGSLLGRSR